MPAENKIPRGYEIYSPKNKMNDGMERMPLMMMVIMKHRTKKVEIKLSAEAYLLQRVI